MLTKAELTELYQAWENIPNHERREILKELGYPSRNTKLYKIHDNQIFVDLLYVIRRRQQNG